MIVSANIKSLLLNIKNTFEFNDNNWKDKAIDFIADGLSIIGCPSIFEKVSEQFDIEDYRVVIPSDVQNIIELTDTCNREIVIMNTNNLLSDCKCSVETSPTYAEINGGWFNFNVETGKVNVIYYKLPLDDDGLPTIPNNPRVFEALGWYVTFKLMLAGNKHHTLTSWKEASNEWDRALPKAENSLRLDEMTPRYMRLMGELWTNPTVRGNLHKVV